MPGWAGGDAVLADSYGRVATDLRVSVTDRCSLRCQYCMPPEGLDWLPKPELLTDDELVRLIRVGVERLGITEIRFTGGEPLVRRGLVGIVARTAALRPRPEISLTTNGIGLDRLAEPLHAAGLDRVNVSLDTLRPETFAAPARRGPAGAAGRRGGRAGRGRGDRAGAGEGQLGAHAGHQRRGCRAAGPVLPGARVST